MSRTMFVLVDGYNLLHVTGIVGKGFGPNTLERARCALLNFVAESSSPEQLPRTTIVFDACNAPPGLPRVVTHQEMAVRYAVGYESADALIEALIAKDSAPRNLLVVSSDHRIQRAAQRRKANFIDSDKWYAQLVENRRAKGQQSNRPLKPQLPLSESEVQFWLQQFSEQEKEQDKTKIEESDDIYNPFPPGYGDDLSEDDI